MTPKHLFFNPDEINIHPEAGLEGISNANSGENIYSDPGLDANFDANISSEPVLNDNQTEYSSYDLDALVFLFSEALPGKPEEIIRPSITKANRLNYENAIKVGFSEDQYLVRSYSKPNQPPHIVLTTDSGLIKCDANCIKYQSEGFCSHCIAVAIKCNSIRSYVIAEVIAW